MLTLLDLGDDELASVACAFGTTTSALGTIIAFRSTCLRLRTIPVVMPSHVNLPMLLTYRRPSLCVYDLDVGRLRWINDDLLRKKNGAHYYEPDDSRVWYQDKFRVLAAEGTARRYGPLSLERVSDEDRALAASPSDPTAVVGGRRSRNTDPSVRLAAAFESLVGLMGVADWARPSLHLVGNSSTTVPPTLPPALALCTRLQQLRVHDCCMPPMRVLELAGHASNLTLLDLSGRTCQASDPAGGYDSVALARLMMQWHAASTTTIRRLILDNQVLVGLRSLAYGLAHTSETPQLVADGEYVAGSVFLSCNRYAVDLQWALNWKQSPEADKIMADGFAMLDELLAGPSAQPTAATAANSRPKKRKKTIAAVQNAQDVPPVVLSAYANNVRERDRYNWQHEDHVCKNCGFVWPKHAVTVSYRQTAVSECLKEKRACDQRSISQAVLGGALWITDKHIVGNPGGNGLTPTPAETLAAEQEGLIVAYLPGAGAPTRQVFAVRDGERVQVS